MIIASQPLDTDSLGSGLILKRYLEFLGKKVTLMFPRKISKKEKEEYSFLSGLEQVEDRDTRKVLKKKNFDLLIFVDGPNLVQFYDSRKEGPPPDLSVYDKRIRIDHHQESGEPLSTYNIIRTNTSSTVELILSDLVPEEFIDQKIVSLAYPALVGDTGNFKWNFYPSTMRLVAKMLQLGLNPYPVIDKMVMTRTQGYLKMLAFAIEHTRYRKDIGSSFLCLSHQELQAKGIDKEKLIDLKNAYNADVARMVPGYPRGFFLYEEKPGLISVSARGNYLNNKINLPKLLAYLGPNGGGHFNACGNKVAGNLEEIKGRLAGFLKKSLEDAGQKK